MELLVLTIVIILISAIYAGFVGAPWVPSKKKTTEDVFSFLEIKEKDVFYDLGCGDGRLVFMAGEKGADARGFEISIFLFFVANLKKFLQKKKGRILYKNFWKANLADADIIYFFLLPKFYPRLKEKMEEELKEGTIVVTSWWEVEGWKPVKVIKKEKEVDVFVYKIGQNH